MAKKGQPSDPTGNGNNASEEESGVRLDVKATGSPEKVRASLAKMGGEREAVPVEDSDRHYDDPIAGLLANAKNCVVVTRVYPPRYGKRRADIRVGKWHCPITREDLEQDVFSRFGGKRYKAAIHPDTANGEAMILDAFTLEHPDPDAPPIFDESLDPIVDDVDPTLEISDDPASVVEQSLREQARLATARLRVKELRRQIRDAERDDEPREDDHAKRDHSSEERVRALEARLEEKDRERKADDRFNKIEGMIERIATQPKGNDNAVLIQMMQNNGTQFAAMMRAITDMNTVFATANRPTAQEGFDTQLARLKTMKEVLGSDDSRVHSLIDLAVERLLSGAAPESEEDTVKYVVKQAMPTIQRYLDSLIAREEAGGHKLTKDQQENLRQQVVQEAMQNAIKQLEREGRIIRAEPQSEQPKLTQQASPSTESQGGAMVKIVDLPGIGTVEAPAKPRDAEYSRSRAVNFVLDSILSEIHQRIPQEKPGESYAAGDILDRLDHELLGSVCLITTGQELEALLAPHAEPGKLTAIKEAGKDDLVESWLRRVIVTVTDEYKRANRKP